MVMEVTTKQDSHLDTYLTLIKMYIKSYRTADDEDMDFLRDDIDHHWKQMCQAERVVANELVAEFYRSLAHEEMVERATEE